MTTSRRSPRIHQVFAETRLLTNGSVTLVIPSPRSVTSNQSSATGSRGCTGGGSAIAESMQQVALREAVVVLRRLLRHASKLPLDRVADRGRRLPSIQDKHAQGETREHDDVTGDEEGVCR